SVKGSGDLTPTWPECGRGAVSAPGAESFVSQPAFTVVLICEPVEQSKGFEDSATLKFNPDSI
ncbi:MAG: hypothetical protein VKI82_05305, partial [Leptolyngbya sp.]|nr:hypothetical protein [Leptolyngbya sp.]